MFQSAHYSCHRPLMNALLTDWAAGYRRYAASKLNCSISMEDVHLNEKHH